MNNIKIALDSWIVGFISFPIAYYVIKRFGGALVEDVKKIAYSVWDKVRPKKV